MKRLRDLLVLFLVISISTSLVGCRQHFSRSASKSPKAILNHLKLQLDALLVDVGEAEALGYLKGNDLEVTKAYLSDACKRYDQLVDIYRLEKKINVDGQEAVQQLIALIAHILKGGGPE